MSNIGEIIISLYLAVVADMSKKVIREENTVLVLKYFYLKLLDQCDEQHRAPGSVIVESIESLKPHIFIQIYLYNLGVIIDPNIGCGVELHPHSGREMTLNETIVTNIENVLSSTGATPVLVTYKDNHFETFKKESDKTMSVLECLQNLATEVDSVTKDVLNTWKGK